MNNGQEYLIFDISKEEENIAESLGTKQKFWYIDDKKEQYLFKSIYTQDKQGNLITREGEDWAEKIASELAEFLRIPHATYELALHNGRRGVISKNFLHEGSWELLLGNALIHNLRRSYKYQPITRVHSVMQTVVKKKPIGYDQLHNIKTASDFFIGYLMLDVLISNQDRHEENWGLIHTTRDTKHLAPTFDHAASLGKSESDAKRKQILSKQNRNYGIEQYVLKAKSYFSLGNDRLTLMEAFMYFAKQHKKSTLSWIDILDSLDENTIIKIIDCVPESIMGSIAKEFSKELICINQLRILNGIK